MGKKDDQAVAERMAKVVGRALGGVPVVAGVRLLQDHKTWDPVVPPDLHEVQPAPVDADGNVTCLYCKKATPFAQADLLGSDGFVCRTCAMSRAVAVSSAPRRSSTPLWVIGAIVVCAAVGLAIVIAARMGPGATASEPPAPAFTMPPELAELAAQPLPSPAELERRVAGDEDATMPWVEPPWIVMAAWGQPDVRIDSRVFDEIVADSNDDGPNLVLMVRDHEVALAVPGTIDDARRLVTELRPAAVIAPRRTVPKGPRVIVGDAAMKVTKTHVVFGERRFTFAEVCRGAQDGTNLELAAGEVQAALVWLTLKADSRRPLCGWDTE